MISIIQTTYIKNNIPISELHFFNGDLTNIDFNTDHRFIPINNRFESTLLGTVNVLSFPVTYPINYN